MEPEAPAVDRTQRSRNGPNEQYDPLMMLEAVDDVRQPSGKKKKEKRDVGENCATTNTVCITAKITRHEYSPANVFQ